jgi:uncharacterized Zn-binding protein involved in type VI secretion
MPRVARLGDPSSHGGVIVSSAARTEADGILIARVGDLHSCPIPGHGVTPIVTGSPTLIVEGKPAARVGSVCGCGAVISDGSPKFECS